MILRLIFLGVLLPATLAVGFLTLYGGAALYRQARTLGYAATTGTVTHSELVTDPESNDIRNADIRYTYEHMGQTFEGRVYRHASMPAGEAQDAVRTRAVGAATQVYFDPRHPADAVLDVGVNGLDLLLPLFVLFGFVALAYCWRAAWGLLARPLLGAFALKLPEPRQCGVKTLTEGARIRARLPYYYPFLAGGTTLGVVGFVAAVGAAFASGSGTADLPLVLAAWGLAIGSAIVVAAWLWREEQSGRADLVIDTAALKVELPAIYGRKAREDLDVSQVTAVAVEGHRHLQSRGGSYFVHSVVLRCGQGKPKIVVMWHDSECAEALATWLRDKLQIPTD